MLNKFGFCSSYKEANNYRRNAASVQGVDAISDIEGIFVQYMADNTDHATKTLDGYGAVHVKGQIMTFTPSISTSRIIPRSTVNMEDVKKICHVKLAKIFRLYLTTFVRGHHSVRTPRTSGASLLV